MNSADSRPLALGSLKSLTRKIAAVIDDCRYAQQRMAALRTAPDRQLMGSNTAPDSYAEFLFRTSGVLLHEPAARARRPGSLRP
jgi:hypothetical protein